MKGVFLVCVVRLAAGQSACSVIMPYPGMQYLTSSQLALYGLTDSCSVACKPGYYGDACNPIPNISATPLGPWNVQGYYTTSVGQLKGMSLSLSTQYSGLSFTGGDSTLVGLYNSQIATSAVKLLSLSSLSITTMLSFPPFLDAVQVRYGQVFVARAFSNSGPYDISTINGPPYTTSVFMNISLRAANIEIFQDKGMNTAFVFSTSAATQYQLRACYPNGTCNLWYTGTSPISSLGCALDCPYAVYIAVQSSIYRVNSTGKTLLVQSPFLITCMTTSPALNTIVFRTNTTVQQLSLGGNGTNILYPNVMTLGVATGVCSGTCCSLDISDSNSLIVLAENGFIHVIEAMQMPCPMGQTSPAVTSRDVSACYSCPPAPINGYLVPGSSVCAWACNVGFTVLGSQCVALPLPPCPKFFYNDGGRCLPSPMPWAPAGSYLVQLNSSLVGYVKPPSTSLSGYVFGAGVAQVQPFVMSWGPTVSFAAMTQNLYASFKDSNVWQVMVVQLSLKAQSQCGYNINNAFYYLMQQGGILWAGFYMRTGASLAFQQHCLWGLDVSKTPSNLTNPVNVSGYWSVGGQVCSATGDGAGNAYVIQCGTNFISKAVAGGGLVVVGGRSSAGYLDGAALAGLLNAPSSVVFYNQRLFVADTGNCVLREVDLARSALSTVAGKPGVCERLDGGLNGAAAGVMYPSNLTLTAYPGFFLFMDQGVSEATPTIRQYHADSGSVVTIQASSIPGVTCLAGLGDRVLISAQSTGAFYEIGAASGQCPGGSVSLQGGALNLYACIQCGAGLYSNGSACLPCSSVVCAGVGQRVLPCGASSDAQCGACGNKPNGSVYTGPAQSYDGYMECPWAYVPPCPIGYYQNVSKTGGVCLACPPWSTTLNSNATSLKQCVCKNGTMATGGTCVVPSPYNNSLPKMCQPLSSCSAAKLPLFPFPIVPTCTASGLDSYLGVCVCQPGQYIAQIYPKVCLDCPSYLYGPDGAVCLNCPAYAVPTMDGTGCRCAGGSQDVAVSSQTLQCACGAGRSFSPAGCISCPANTVSPGVLTLSGTPWLQSKACVACPAGTFAGVGQGQCEPCPGWTYREAGMGECTDCRAGQYATDPTAGGSCKDCAAACGGRLQTPCPTDPSLYVCKDCPQIRANARYNGLDNCATSCLDGYYESDLECVRCTEFNATGCPAGNYLAQCGAYYDSECLPCANATKPDFFSVWAPTPNGPSLSCLWECIVGYTAQELSFGLWKCVEEGGWSMMDLFTV